MKNYRKTRSATLSNKYRPSKYETITSTVTETDSVSSSGVDYRIIRVGSVTLVNVLLIVGLISLLFVSSLGGHYFSPSHLISTLENYNPVLDLSTEIAHLIQCFDAFDGSGFSISDLIDIFQAFLDVLTSPFRSFGNLISLFNPFAHATDSSSYQKIFEWSAP